MSLNGLFSKKLTAQVTTRRVLTARVDHTFRSLAQAITPTTSQKKQKTIRRLCPANAHGVAYGSWRYTRSIRCSTMRGSGEVLRTTKTGNAIGAKFRSTSTLKAPNVSSFCDDFNGRNPPSDSEQFTAFDPSVNDPRDAFSVPGGNFESASKAYLPPFDVIQSPCRLTSYSTRQGARGQGRQP